MNRWHQHGQHNLALVQQIKWAGLMLLSRWWDPSNEHSHRHLWLKIKQSEKPIHRPEMEKRFFKFIKSMLEKVPRIHKTYLLFCWRHFTETEVVQNTDLNILVLYKASRYNTDFIGNLCGFFKPHATRFSNTLCFQALYNFSWIVLRPSSESILKFILLYLNELFSQFW